MNIFSEFQIKIFKTVKTLEKKKIIKVPVKLKTFTIELPPKNQNADISCNAPMILAKINNCTPFDLANILKEHLLLNIKEFNNIEIAKPGFLNIYLNDLYKTKCLTKIISPQKLKRKRKWV